MTCFYQVTVYIILKHHTDDNNAHHDNLISNFMGKALVALAVYLNDNKEHGIKVELKYMSTWVHSRFLVGFVLVSL